MARIGLDADVLDSGCCGLAGDFGMTPDHRDVSLGAAPSGCSFRRYARPTRPTLVIADGFSCRTQIGASGSGRRGVHLAEVLAAAVRGSASTVRAGANVAVSPECRTGRLPIDELHVRATASR